MSGELKLPDEMGVWSEDGVIWVTREHYPTRWDAIKFGMEHLETYCLPDVRCRSRYMRYQPHVVPPFEWDGRKDPGYTDDEWYECAPDADGAFRVWRLEPAPSPVRSRDEGAR